MKMPRQSTFMFSSKKCRMFHIFNNIWKALISWRLHFNETPSVMKRRSSRTPFSPRVNCSERNLFFAALPLLIHVWAAPKPWVIFSSAPLRDGWWLSIASYEPAELIGFVEEGEVAYWNVVMGGGSLEEIDQIKRRSRRRIIIDSY